MIVGCKGYGTACARLFGFVLLAPFVFGACSAAPSASDFQSESDDRVELGSAASSLTAEERLAACASDPRVVAGLVSQRICAGASVFFNETFAGNGRTCGSCHPVANNYTLDVPFVQTLHASKPEDPLFVHERVPALAKLETDDLLNGAGILENVDGFEAPTTKFVSRGVNHIYSLATSVAADPGDGTSRPPLQRTGWGGDGAAGDGSLRGFLEGAIRQHLTKTLARRSGVDFRLPSELEADLTLAFQNSVGRLRDIDLGAIRFADERAENGRAAFLDPARGRCNVCHSNAGSNFQDTGLNKNFNTDVNRQSGSLLLAGMPDGGFGGQGLTSPNVDVNGSGFPNAYGNGTFSPPPLIEAADTGPFFHNNLVVNPASGTSLEGAVAFYGLAGSFRGSPADHELARRFGPFQLLAGDGLDIARMLRVLNAAFNIEIARQRLSAVDTLAARFGNTRLDVQRRLLELSIEELLDAINVLSAVEAFYTNSLTELSGATNHVRSALAADSIATRRSHAQSARSFAGSAKELFGFGIAFELGQGNLMY